MRSTRLTNGFSDEQQSTKYIDLAYNDALDKSPIVKPLCSNIMNLPLMQSQYG
jgi:hypothetical protein